MEAVPEISSLPGAGAGQALAAEMLQARNAARMEARLGGADVVGGAAKAAEVGGDGLSDEERAVVEKLKARDREVRDHEQAHARVGGQYASEPSYSYQVGPDGRQYAIGGQVKIDVSPVRDDPAATIAKMEIVKAAALAPAEPSSADRQVAATADAVRAQAQADLNAERAAERRGEAVDVRV